MISGQIGFNDPVTAIKGVGPGIAGKLRKLKIDTVFDLLNHLPRKYLDFTRCTPINEAVPKTAASFLGQIFNLKSFYTHSKKLITTADLVDSSGKITLTWFNNPYIKKIITPGEEYSVAGTPAFFASKLTLISPMIESGNSFTLNTKGLVPVYPQTEGITSRWFRKTIYQLLHQLSVPEPIDSAILKKHGLPGLTEAINRIHFPQDRKQRQLADQRLSFNEHLKINIANFLANQKLGKSPRLRISPDLHQAIKNKLPFQLTLSQEKAVAQIYKDLQSYQNTHRLIQGETGSGKTLPLIFAANQAVSAGYHAVIMAPTEILAKQHLLTFTRYSVFSDKIELVTGSSKVKESKTPHIYIGTHALISQLPSHSDIQTLFVAIDEQHKFGVDQRNIFGNQTNPPHLFNLSATPIPRTLALGMFGEIKITNLKHKPSNRLPVKTHLITPTKFKDSPRWLTSQLKNGSQIYVVCPSIHDRSQNVSSIERETEIYKRLLPPNTPIFPIHGKLSAENQVRIIAKFKDAPGSVLISTSLIEVGIDIPTANIMIIHSAEMFGLAQLHQLRGRVGRGEEQGYCFLVPTTDDDIEIERLELLNRYHDGLTLSQKDLRLRGAGELFGKEQHGRFQTKLQYFWSKKIFQKAKTEAKKMVNTNRNEAKHIASRLSTW